AYPRVRAGGKGVLALTLGVLGLAASIEALHYTRAVGPSGDDFTGLLCAPAGLFLLGLGAVTLWRAPARGGARHPPRPGRRVAGGRWGARGARAVWATPPRGRAGPAGPPAGGGGRTRTSRSPPPTACA